MFEFLDGISINVQYLMFVNRWLYEAFNDFYSVVVYDSQKSYEQIKQNVVINILLPV